MSWWKLCYLWKGLGWLGKEPCRSTNTFFTVSNEMELGKLRRVFDPPGTEFVSRFLRLVGSSALLVLHLVLTPHYPS
jgi:hypothetical protein